MFVQLYTDYALLDEIVKLEFQKLNCTVVAENFWLQKSKNVSNSGGLSPKTPYSGSSLLFDLAGGQFCAVLYTKLFSKRSAYAESWSTSLVIVSSCPRMYRLEIMSLHWTSSPSGPPWHSYIHNWHSYICMCY